MGHEPGNIKKNKSPNNFLDSIQNLLKTKLANFKWMHERDLQYFF